jgi:hypothetical protein
MLIFGGTDASGLRLNDLQMFDTISSNWYTAPTVLGSIPVARAMGTLTPITASSVALYAGLSTSDALNDLNLLTFPSCPIPSLTGVSTVACYSAQTVCFVTCLPGYNNANSGSPIICHTDGTWIGNTPPCTGAVPSVPLSVTAFPASTSATVVWTAPTSTGSYPSIDSYTIQAVPTLFQLTGFGPGVAPSDWSNWRFSDQYNYTQFYAFSAGGMSLETNPNGNCWKGVNSCPFVYRNTFPSNIPYNNFYVESYAYQDVISSIPLASTFTGIAMIDAATAAPHFHLGVMNSGGYKVLWEHTWGNWSQSVPLTSSVVGAYLRIVRDGTAGTWTAQYKLGATDPWLSFSIVANNAAFLNGPPTGTLRPAFMGRNWSGSKFYQHYLSYLTIGSTSCSPLGTTRIVPGTVTSVAIAGLAPKTQYTFQVQAANAAGRSASGVSSAVTTSAASSTASYPVINVALNKPSVSSGSISPATAAYQANDGNRNTYGNTPYYCIDTGVIANAFGSWQVDFGSSADIQWLRLYVRSDCCASRSTGLQIYIGDSPSYQYNTLCNVYTNVLAAPWYQDINCTLTGRYLTVLSNRLGDSLNFCELEAYAANACPTRSAPFASAVAGTKCSGAAFGDICQLSCGAGYVAVAGSATSICRGASWDQPTLVCAPTCSDLFAPADYGTCTQALISESFDNSSDTMARFASTDSTSNPMGTAWLIADGMLQAAAIPGCNNLITTFSTSSKVYNYQSGFSLQVSIMSSDVAGLVFKLTDALNYYKFGVDFQAKLAFFDRVTAGVALRIIDIPVTVVGGKWYTITVDYSNAVMNFSLSGQNVLSSTDKSFLVGYAGVFAESTAFFDDLMFAVSCATCSASTPGLWCQYTCAPGLLSSNNGTSVCKSSADGISAVWTGASPVCSVPPPVFYSSSRSIEEFASVNSQVGTPLVATVADPTSQVLYKIIAGNINGAFWIDSCSGQIRVKYAILDVNVVPVYTLTVTAYIAGFEAISYTSANCTVTLVPVPLPPVVAPQVFMVAEGAPAGTFVGRMNFTSHLPMTVAWTWSIDSSSGAFVINPTSGIITVANSTAAAALRYYTFPNRFDNLVLATSVSNPPLASLGSVSIQITEINIAPVLRPTSQVLPILETAAVQGATVGVVGAFKQNQPPSPFSSNITYSLITGAPQAQLCPLNVSVGHLWYPTPSGLYAAGTSLFYINPVNGTLSVGDLSQVTDGGPDPWRLYPVFSYGNAFARAAYSVCVNLSDARGGFSVGAITVVIVANIPAQPAITSTSVNILAMQTIGGENISFYGQNFGAPGVLKVKAWSTNGASSYNATNCTVLSASEIVCTSVPGAGTGFTWTVWLDQGRVSSSSPLIAAYATPTISAISGAVLLSTSVPSMVVVDGTNFGPPGTQVSLKYGSTTQFSCTPVTNNSDSHIRVRCMSSTGSGSGLPWSLTIATQTWTWTAMSGLPLFSYAPPYISSISVSGDNITALDSAGGANVVINGGNFGEPGAALLVTFGGAIGDLLPFSNCFQALTSQIKCKLVPAVGKDLPVMIWVSGVAALSPTSGLAALGMGISYRAPVISQIGGVGASSGTTAGGQQIFIYGSHFGPITYPVNQVTSALYGHPGFLNYAATSCRVTQEPPLQSIISCLSAPGMQS